uniref:Uncharacterized protein n=1 Tax=Chromera velia CCMP2878 TaxID=1169474 RepID=A0A0G4HCG4_9ALVE|mmetsp:Transcript_20921/g.41729  ORF Transcript_20921/g.41729 Transcript_20921/m.41729 type:complete len:246 (-) Transcript_20921:117-854(-)|eukprot:Cvel_26069.t1-p1 / transcript=Cvel_26069.t1 / gene=Cvel_26069 / organism=Chromera_velia_CCMP2878 / gene_product=hypothetical protein / transcript_product=hypothetical protein / location=Cvel_scaffold3042:16150-16884(+) / protein_length=245 / sequence_SO=supercontig / SO=protein_coding / is_pseudo=false
MAENLEVFGYTQAMFMAGAVWVGLEIWGVWVARKTEGLFWEALARSFEENEDVTFGEANIKVSACHALADRQKFSYFEVFGILVGLAVWVPDPLRKRLVSATFNDSTWKSYDTLIGLFPVLLILLGAFYQYRSLSHRAQWVQERMDSSSFLEEPIFFHQSRGVKTRFPHLTARLILLFGWAVLSLNGSSLLAVVGATVEFNYVEARAISDRYAEIWGEEMVCRWEEEVPSTVFRGDEFLPKRLFC